MGQDSAGASPMSSRSSQAYEDLRDLLLAGRFPPNTRLTEAELTDMLEVSRGTVRAVLVRLVQEGYLTSEPNVGVRTRFISIPEALAILEARETLESALAEKAAERATDEELDELVEVCDEMSASEYVESEAVYSRLNRRFHQLIRDSARQPILTTFADSLVYPLVMRQYRDLTHTSPRQMARIEHRAILSALQTRNTDAAAAAMRHHTASARRSLLKSVQSDRDDPVE
ncbi:GntR family transcriptional regulator [Nocardioides sp. Kera G14]|uniref:GntR family transcriptional regulator n=1 Tax=Nocardioides sp. Kera G14 TaxID=2884264 RepID=UPI001D0F5B2E|nr:GntR family transcriptional regulator [Nocardioides sp. Kera G14]UDY23921.1 GntR family transcriptional regulator [Nocardioides sp. Kera G14]